MRVRIDSTGPNPEDTVITDLDTGKRIKNVQSVTFVRTVEGAAPVVRLEVMDGELLYEGEAEIQPALTTIYRFGERGFRIKYRCEGCGRREERSSALGLPDAPPGWKHADRDLCSECRKEGKS